ncbi:MAG TPA: ribonuclease III [Candidatus Acidoferrales bacterium]|nr:ribonuclease III [Candidatus Acidoferrales bacterium]
MQNLSELEAALGYRFRDKGRLIAALTHSSALDVAQPRTAERLEFLGDAVVGLALSDALLDRFPEHNEGQLSKFRAAMVNTHSLADRARALGLDRCLRLGKGEEKTGGREKASILAATYESVIGAIFLDASYAVARQVVVRHFETALAADRWRQADPKTELQELCQGRFRTAPSYRVIEESGPFHDRRFVVDVTVAGAALARGAGRSKRLAEQDAARRALLMCATPTAGSTRGDL